MTSTAASCPFCSLGEATEYLESSLAEPTGRKITPQKSPETEQLSERLHREQFKQEEGRKSTLHAEVDSKLQSYAWLRGLKWLASLALVILLTILVATSLHRIGPKEIADRETRPEQPKQKDSNRQIVPILDEHVVPELQLPTEPPLTPEREHQARVREARQTIRRIEEDLSSGERISLSKRLSLPSEILAILEATPEDAQRLWIAQESSRLADEIHSASPTDLERTLTSWRDLVACSPTFAENSGLLSFVQATVNAHTRHLIETRAWKEVEPFLLQIKRYAPTLSESDGARELGQILAHWQFLQKARNARRPHNGISQLEQNPPPEVLVSEHSEFLQYLQMRLFQADREEPQVQPLGKKSLKATENLKLYFDIQDDYEIVETELRFWRDTVDGNQIFRIPLQHDSLRWLALIPVSDIEQKRIHFEIVARDRSGNETIVGGSATRGTIRRNRWTIDWK